MRDIEKDQGLWIRMKDLEEPVNDKGKKPEMVFWKVGDSVALFAKQVEGQYHLMEFQKDPEDLEAGKEFDPSEMTHLKEIEKGSGDDWEALTELTKEIASRGGTVYVREPKDLKQARVVQKAKLLKKELKYHFPDQKFSVTTEKYSGGSSINVAWENGVPTKEVEKVTGKYSYSYPDEDLRSDYHHSDNHVFTKRKVSDDARQKIKDRILDKFADGEFGQNPMHDNTFQSRLHQRTQRTEFDSDGEIVREMEDSMEVAH